MIFVAHFVVVVVYSFLQFYYSLNKPAPFAALLMLISIAVVLYFLGWWAVLSLLIGGMLGGYQAVAWMKKNRT